MAADPAHRFCAGDAGVLVRVVFGVCAVVLVRLSRCVDRGRCLIGAPGDVC